jgi:hypothetical protein
MTESASTSSPDPSPALPPPARPCRKRQVLRFVIVILATAGFVVLALWPRHSAHDMVAGDDNALRERVAVLEQKVGALENKLSEMNAHVDSSAAIAIEPAPTGAKLPAGDTARLQSDVVALSAGLAALQAEVKQDDKDNAQNQRAAQSLFAASIAFLQLRAAAESGHGFVNELAAMRVATRDFSAFQPPLIKLEPYALNGVPSTPMLYTQFRALASATAQAIDQAGAQNWWQRIVAALKGLIVVRPLNGPDNFNDAIAGIENNLAQGVVTTAVDTANNLPPAAAETLKNWRAEAEARAAVDDALHTMADLLVAAALPPPRDAP